MPPISLDQQVFFDASKLKNPKIQRQERNLWHDTRVSQAHAQIHALPDNDTILISSDGESDDDGSASVQTDLSLPSIDQILADTQKSGKLVDLHKGAEENYHDPDLDEGDDHSAQRPMVDRSEPRSLSTPDVQNDSDVCQSLASLCSQASTKPIISLDNPPESDVPLEVANPLELDSQPQPDHVVCRPEVDIQHETVESMSDDIVATRSASHFSSDSIRCSPKHQANAPRSDRFYNSSVCESGNNEDSSELHSLKSKLRQRKTPIHYASCSALISETESADENQHRRKRRRSALHTPKTPRDDPYEPLEDDSDEEQAPRHPLHSLIHELSGSSEVEMDEDSESICPRPSKSRRPRKAILSPSLTIPRGCAKGGTQADSGKSSRWISSAASRYTIPSPPHSQSSGGEAHTQAPTAKFEEWPLGQAVLKRVTINGSVTFQLQFTWEPYKSKQASTQVGLHNSLSHSTRPITKRRAVTKSYSPEEDSLIIALKEQGLSWKDIHTQHRKLFPERSIGTLQVRYSTKLKHK
jgi:hypothetical protein